MGPIVEIREKSRSSLPGLWKYPSLRDGPLHTGGMWLQGRREDDGAEGLWRVHDRLYDLSGWEKSHPGGADWITLTKGTDITEAFEVHHIRNVADAMLKQFYVRDARTRRNSPYTFKENGFYRTLKARAREALANEKYVGSTGTMYSKILADSLVTSMLALSVVAAWTHSFAVAMLAGLLLAFTAICAHNFTHLKDNLRMYYFDFSMMSSRDWRISHVLSHHLYTNTLLDLEVSMFEPWFKFLPFEEKNFFTRYVSWIYSPIVGAISFHVCCISRVVDRFRGSKLEMRKSDLIPLIIPASMVFIAGASLLEALYMWTYITVCGSLFFVFIGLTAAHHHPLIFHDGDTPRADLDWGIQQLDAVRDRPVISSSDILALTFFGHHGLHHLFPTVDHRILHKLYPAFQKTCAEFGIEYNDISFSELVRGAYLQVARTKPNTVPPGSGKH
ncbi:cytochrome b5-related protein-like isoform X1 [Schistocerca piceifrons]|uniref:cytochrome b5-related protein-like isoform X1 n=1 Tax=Schistocerca piceifrons TaxID=274613 RepID=UPI001F5F1F0B|nr:cytochrome b5-related protein-like isoform X1 [Schistocerca piceifrons]